MNAIGEILSSAALAACLLAGAGWLFRTWIITRLSADIRLETDSKLENLKASLRRTSDAVTSISSTGSLAYTQTQVALLPHRIKAAHSVWSSVLEWGQMSSVSMFVSTLPRDWIRENSSDPATKRTFDALLGGKDYLDFLKRRQETELARPLISERAWALYAAFSALYFSRVSRAAMLTISSLDHDEVWSRIDERSLIKESAPPEILSSYDDNIVQGTNAYLEYLKTELLNELRSDLSGSRDSDNALSNASKIVAAATQLVQNSDRSVDTAFGSNAASPG